MLLRRGKRPGARPRWSETPRRGYCTLARVSWQHRGARVFVYRHKIPRSGTLLVALRTHEKRQVGLEHRVTTGRGAYAPWPLRVVPVGREGLEPSWTHAQRILSPQRLPFRHRPTSPLIITSGSRSVKEHGPPAPLSSEGRIGVSERRLLAWTGRAFVRWRERENPPPPPQHLAPHEW